MRKMNPDIKARWVAALRSGEYKQGRGRLRSSANEFCCLGVLCNLHAQANPEYAAMQSEPTLYGGGDGLPPQTVTLWAGFGLYENDPIINFERHRLPISAHNDGKWNGKQIPRRTFAEIADAIEAQL